MGKVHIVLALAALASASAYEDYHYVRNPRASAGAFSGVSNGQFYGGTYQSPDNGPTLFNRFGDVPPSAGHQGSNHNGFGVQGPNHNGFGAQGPNHNGFGPQQPPFQNPNELNQFFQSYFKQLNDNLAASVYRGVPHHSSSSHSSFSFSDPPQRAFAKNFQYQQAAFNAAQQAFQAAANNRFGPGYTFNDFGPGNTGFAAAGASGSFGPGGGHQSANLYPPNPANPNIHNRFGDSPTPGGSFGVSSSSFSGTADVNGKRTVIKEASTTINDNGKVSTYTVRN